MSPHDRIEEIRTAADRIAAYAASIKQAHALGHGPGSIDELWERQFQEKALHVYTKSIPWGYLINLANGFRRVSKNMTVAGAPDDVADEWLIVTDYLRNAAEVILAFAPPGHIASQGPLDGTTPSVMEFGLLGEIASAAGAGQLYVASNAVSRASRATTAPATTNLLYSDQVTVLELYSSGTTMVEIGNRLGYSTRTVQRKLDAIQQQLGVASRNEAIALAAANGWIALSGPHRKET